MRALRRSHYYVYALIDPRDGQFFYIGKGCGDRCNQHHAEWRREFAKRSNYPIMGKNPAKLQRFTDIFYAGMEVQVSILADHMLEIDALNLEADLIEEHRPTLTNVIGRGGLAAGSRIGWALSAIENAIKHIASPREWAKALLLSTGKLPTDADWAMYLDLYTGHLKLRDDLRRMHADAEKEADKAA